MRRTNVAFLAASFALCAVACSRQDKGQGAPAGSARARVDLPPLPSGDPRAKPECEAPRACLARVMPEVFESSQAPDLEQKARGCLGDTIERAWDLRECLPFAFGRDKQSGQMMQVSINCGDLCPAYARLVFGLAEQMSEFECICRGFYPVVTPGWGGYVGCALRPPNANPRFFDVIEPRAGQRVVVQGDPRFGDLGFLQYAVIDSVDGAPVTTAEELTRGLEGIPQRLPGVIRMHLETPETIKELHYVTREVVDSLAKLAADLDLRSLATVHTACLNPEGDAKALRALVRVSFGGGTLSARARAAVFRKPDCTDDQTKRVLQFEEAVRRAADEAKPRTVTPQASPAACKAVEGIRVFSIGRGAEELELRYADWAAR